MAKKDTSGTEPQTAPETETPAPVAPAPVQRVKQVERQGSAAVPYVHRYPEVRGGVCEFCGVLDNTIPSQFQYKLCPHYRGQQLRCSYCDATKDPDEVLGRSVLNVYDHPDNPDKLVVVCDNYECTRKHEGRFQTAS